MAATPRTNADFTSLLLECARALRGFSFYAETDPKRRPLLDRAFRALSSELERSGPIDLRLGEGTFILDGLATPIPAGGALDPLAGALGRHGIERLRLDPSLTRNALDGFLDLLGQPVDRFESPTAFARILSARDSRGLRINDLEDPARHATPRLDTTPPCASASLASGFSSPMPTRSPPSSGGESKKPTLESHPLEVPSPDDRGERLRARLIELDQFADDSAYQARVADISVWAQELWNQGLIDECYRALLVLADHAVGCGGRPETQARMAAACFAELASGERLHDLIRRATGSSGTGVRAAQLLLQLGPTVVPELLDRICEEPDPDRSAPLHALIMTMGEAALPTLISAIQGPDDHRARIGIRLAGELQSPAALPTLLASLRSPSLSRRTETIRALSLLPGDEAKQVLANALESNYEEIAVAATRAVATAEGPDAVPMLLDILEASLRTSRTKVSRTLVEVLGRIGDERVVPRLSAILERKPILRRAHHHAIQLAAIDALAILPTREARRAIERAARHGARPVRDRARDRLDELSRRH